MPHRALQVCSTPSCATLTPKGRCPSCRATARRTQAAQRRQAGDTSMDVYSTEAWRQQGAGYFKRHPTCVDCGQPATQRDHVPARRILLAAGIHDPDHERWWQARCDSCHSRVTVTRDKPLLARLAAGEDPTVLAEEAMRHG